MERNYLVHVYRVKNIPPPPHTHKEKVHEQWAVLEPSNVNDSMIRVFVERNKGFYRVYDDNMERIIKAIPIRVSVMETFDLKEKWQQ